MKFTHLHLTLEYIQTHLWSNGSMLASSVVDHLWSNGSMLASSVVDHLWSNGSMLASSLVDRYLTLEYILKHVKHNIWMM